MMFLKLDSFDAGSEMTEAERYERQGYEDNFNETSSDPSMKQVTVTEAYMRMDVDGTGVAVLHRVFMRWNEVQIARL